MVEDPNDLTNSLLRNTAILRFMIGTYNLKPRFKSIMIIDDNEIDCFITEHMLTNYTQTGSIIKYESSKKALDHIKAHGAPQLIILELVLVDITGIGFIEKLKELRIDLINTKIIVISAYLECRPKLACKVSLFPQVSKICSKPITLDLLKEISQLMDFE